MNKILPFLNLIRFKNLAIIVLTQYFVKYSLINYFVNEFILSDLNFFLLVLATILITAAGYIINDLYDLDIDKINKKNTVIIDTHISSKQAIWWYAIFNITGLILGLYLAFIVDNLILSIIFIYSAYSLFSYSRKFKKSFLVGNIQIALLTALCIVNIPLYDIWSNGVISDDGEVMTFKIILYYAGFSALITFIREIIKDIEDYSGDLAYNAKTLVITLGIKKAKQLVMLFIAITIFFISYVQYFQYSIMSTEFEYEISIWGANNTAVIYIIFIQLLFVYLSLKVYKAKEKKDFYFISQLCKIIMILGVFSIPIFTYLHLN